MDSNSDHLNRVKRNVAKMVSIGAPESDIDNYISDEGTTIDDIKNLPPPVPMNGNGGDGPPPAPSGGKRKVGADEALVRNFAQGVTFNTADEISSGIMAGVDALRGEDLGDSYDRRLASARAQDAEIAEQRPVLSVVGQAAGGLATLPAGIAARGATGGARILQAAAQSAGYGAVSGFGAGEGGLENRVNSAAGGAVTGAVFGGGAQGLGEGAKAAGKAILPDIGKEVATLAQRAKEFGIPVSMQQIAPGKIRNTLQKVSQAIPLSGVKGFEEQQTQSWNKALAKTLGEESDNLGPETIQNFLSKSSDGFDNVLKGKSVQVDPLNVETLDTLVENSKGSLSDSLVKVIQKNVDDLKANIGADNVIPGEKLASFRSKLLKRIGRAEGGAKEYLGDVVDVVDDLLDTSLDDASEEALGKLRRQWRNYRTVEPLLEKSATGEVNPTSLLNRVASSPYIKASSLKTGDDDLVDLARIGKDLLPKLGGSDTFEKTSLGAGIATTALNPVLGAKILGGVALNRAFQSFYNQSGKVVDAAIRKSLGDKAEPAIKLLSKGAPLDVVTKAISKSGAGDEEVKEAVEYISRMASKAKDGVPTKTRIQVTPKGYNPKTGKIE